MSLRLYSKDAYSIFSALPPDVAPPFLILPNRPITKPKNTLNIIILFNYLQLSLKV